MSMFGPPVPSFGPLNAKIFILGMFPGREESEKGRPFVGASGYELRKMLSMVGVNLDDCFRANVFSRNPDGDNVALYGVPEKHPSTAPYGPLTGAPITYLHPQWLGDVERVHAEIEAVKPNIIIALGNIACWALGLGQGINAIRGSVQSVSLGGRQVKVLPTIHPAALFRQWDQRVIILQDLDKAKDEADDPDFHFDNTELWLQPTLDDLREFDNAHMVHAKECAADIETKRGQITAISFAPTPSYSLAIPFWVDVPGVDPNYWPSAEEELVAWAFVRKWMEREDLTKVFQNGLYDLQYIPLLGITPRACTEDTMLAHHGLYTELKKGLGFLGSVYANVPSWKSMRTFRKEEQLKRDD
jgi:uracil-DNA glycosylase